MKMNNLNPGILSKEFMSLWLNKIRQILAISNETYKFKIAYHIYIILCFCEPKTPHIFRTSTTDFLDPHNLLISPKSAYYKNLPAAQYFARFYHCHKEIIHQALNNHFCIIIPSIFYLKLHSSTGTFQASIGNGIWEPINAISGHLVTK